MICKHVLLLLGPYLSLVVVTRHDTNPGLFNTKFRLNFGRMANSPPEDPADIASQPNALIIGRSSSCSMVLDYRTVSTVHAILYYNEGMYVYIYMCTSIYINTYICKHTNICINISINMFLYLTGYIYVYN
jgi:hypothetical protein